VCSSDLITEYEVIEDLGDFSLVRVKLETGRTHQIRVHMAHIGHPVAGDQQYCGRYPRGYGDEYPSRQLLHAAVLSFIHPGKNRTVSFNAALPADMASFIRQKRAK